MQPSLTNPTCSSPTPFGVCMLSLSYVGPPLLSHVAWESHVLGETALLLHYKIVTWNVAGLVSKLESPDLGFSRDKFDICLFQETLGQLDQFLMQRSAASASSVLSEKERAGENHIYWNMALSYPEYGCHTPRRRLCIIVQRCLRESSIDFELEEYPSS